MKASDFDFHLPESLIALRPVEPRDSCRLLVLHRDGSIEHKRFFELPEYLSEGDLLLLNNTKVFPARIIGRKKTGGKIEFLLIREISPGLWEVLCKQRYAGTITVSSGLRAEMHPDKTVRFEISGNGSDGGDGSRSAKQKQVEDDNSYVIKTLWKVGLMPLPPYIKREPDRSDRSSYQTVYADKVGSVAAPTAGLHFTEDLLSKIRDRGVIVRHLTLHVGVGTFKPIRVEDPADHHMDAERFEIDESLLRTASKVKESGRSIFSVGTTTTRAIEGFFSGVYERAGSGEVTSHRGASLSPRQTVYGSTDIFIYPGYRFGLVDSLVTNFHLPGSTPLMLTSALCGRENLMKAYSSALSYGYRFFSYGDAMLIL